MRGPRDEQPANALAEALLIRVLVVRLMDWLPSAIEARWRPACTCCSLSRQRLWRRGHGNEVWPVHAEDCEDHFLGGKVIGAVRCDLPMQPKGTISPDDEYLPEDW